MKRKIEKEIIYQVLSKHCSENTLNPMIFIKKALITWTNSKKGQQQ